MKPPAYGEHPCFNVLQIKILQCEPHLKGVFLAPERGFRSREMLVVSYVSVNISLYMKRISILALLLCMALGFITACSPSSTPTEPTPPSTNAPSAK